MVDGASWIETLSLWIQAHPAWAGVFIFLVAFTESIVVVGILIPGIMILFALGALIGLGLVDFYWAWLTASVGAILGDSFSYWLGFRYRDSLYDRWPFKRWPELLAQGRELFQRRGVMGVIIGRFVGPLRPIVPVVAGMLGMPPQRFYPTATVAGIAWAPAYLLPGVVLGASLDVASAYTLRLAVLLGMTAAIIWAVAISMREVYLGLTRRTPWLLKRSVSTLRRHPLLARYIGPLVIPARGDVLSIAMLGLVLVASLSVLSGMLLYAVIPGTPDFDQLTRAGAQALRNHVADYPFLISLFSGDWRVLLITASGLLTWLMASGRTLAAWHWLAAVAGAPCLALILQALVRLFPDWPQGLSEWGRFPDLATVTIATVLGFFPVLMARDIRAHQRKWLYLSMALMIMMSILARLYFQRATPSGIFSAVVLATIWATIVGIGFRVRAEAWHPPGRPIALFTGLFFGGLLILSLSQFNTRLEALTPEPELQTVDSRQWRQHRWRELPHERGFAALPGEAFYLQWHSPLQAIQQQLTAHAWQWHDESPDALQMLAIIHPQPEAEKLPLFRKDYHGRAAEGLASKMLDEEKRAVLRLWDSGWRLDDGEPVWLVEAVVETVQVHGWWFALWTPVAQDAPNQAVRQLLTDIQGREIHPPRHAGEREMNVWLLP